MRCGNRSVVDFTVVLVSRTTSFCCGRYHDAFIFPAHLGMWVF